MFPIAVFYSCFISLQFTDCNKLYRNNRLHIDDVAEAAKPLTLLADNLESIDERTQPQESFKSLLQP